MSDFQCYFSIQFKLMQTSCFNKIVIWWSLSKMFIFIGMKSNIAVFFSKLLLKANIVKFVCFGLFCMFCLLPAVLVSPTCSLVHLYVAPVSTPAQVFSFSLVSINTHYFSLSFWVISIIKPLLILSFVKLECILICSFSGVFTKPDYFPHHHAPVRVILWSILHFCFFLLQSSNPARSLFSVFLLLVLWY